MNRYDFLEARRVILSHFYFFIFGCTVPGYPGGLLAVLVGVFYLFYLLLFLFASRGGFVVGLLYYIFPVFSLYCLQWI